MDNMEALLKAKFPCPETGIEVKRTICDICCPCTHCGIDAYVKDGVVIKVEGTKEHPATRAKSAPRATPAASTSTAPTACALPAPVGERGEASLSPSPGRGLRRDRPAAERREGNPGARLRGLLLGLYQVVPPVPPPLRLLLRLHQLRLRVLHLL